MKLSIITICRNDLEGLKKTIPSVLSQSFTDFEYIIIDGGSDDGSVAFIESHSTRLAYWKSEKDRGIYHAMNKGIDAAKGEYCLFLNSGDYLVSDDVLQKVFQMNLSDDIIYGDMIIDYGDRRVNGVQPDKVTFEFLVLTTIWHPVTFFKRTLFDSIGRYNEELKIVSDYEFILKAILIHNVTSIHLNFPISVFNTKGIGSDPKFQKLQDEERMLVLRKYFPEKVIRSAQDYNLLKRSRAVMFADSLKGYPFLLNKTAGAYRFLKSVRKIFKK